MPELSVVAPVYNEYNNLEKLTKEIVEALNGEIENYEIIYINDGSNDGSGKLMNDLAKKYEPLKVYHFVENNGQTAAFAAAFEKAQGEFVATLDADLQVTPADIPKMMRKIDKYDVVCGIRKNRHDSWVKKISSKIANGFRNWVTNEIIQDTGCPLKLFRQEVVKDYNLFVGMHRFFPTLAKLNGYRVTEIPVRHFSRKYGESKYGINNRLWKGLRDTFAVKWMQNNKIDYSFREGQD